MTRYLLVMGLFALLLGGCGKEEAPEEKAGTDAAQEAPAAIAEQAESAAESLGEVATEAEEAVSEEAQAAMDEAQTLAEEADAAVEEGVAEAEAAVEQGVAEAQSAAEEVAAEAEEAATAVADEASAAVEELSPAAGADTARGKEVYDSTCFVCHGTGAAGAPVLGNKAAWEPRIAQGMEVLVSNSINGIRGMPPKGGSMNLSDEDMAAAVAYMVEQVK